jgi:hypothetical protein
MQRRRLTQKEGLKMMIRILFASAALVALAAPRPATAETTWGSCVTNKWGSLIAVDVKAYPTNAIKQTITLSPGQPVKYTYTPSQNPTFEKKSLPAAKSFCTSDGGTYTWVVSANATVLAKVALGAAFAAEVAAGGYVACVGSAGMLCPVVAATVGTIAKAGFAALVPDGASLFVIDTVKPGYSIAVGGNAFSPTSEVTTTAQSVICEEATVGYACYDGQKAGVCVMGSAGSGNCKVK